MIKSLSIFGPIFWLYHPGDPDHSGNDEELVNTMDKQRYIYYVVWKKLPPAACSTPCTEVVWEGWAGVVQGCAGLCGGLCGVLGGHEATKSSKTVLGVRFGAL